MIPEPRAHLDGSLCPCCGAEETRLYPCLGCDWGPVPGRGTSKEHLEAFKPGSAVNAYNATGCRVCDRCRYQMRQRPNCCPLNLFHAQIQALEREAFHVLRPEQYPRDLTPEPLYFLPQITPQWDRWLAERRLCEKTQQHWRALLAFLRDEEEEPEE